MSGARTGAFSLMPFWSAFPFWPIDADLVAAGFTVLTRAEQGEWRTDNGKPYADIVCFSPGSGLDADRYLARAPPQQPLSDGPGGHSCNPFLCNPSLLTEASIRLVFHRKKRSCFASRPRSPFKGPPKMRNGFARRSGLRGRQLV